MSREQDPPELPSEETLPARDAGGAEGIEQIQRARLYNAIGTLIYEDGMGAISATRVISRAGISRRTFYGLFDDLDECMEAALEDAVQSAAAAVVPAYRAQSDWRERIRAGVIATLTFFDAEPVIGRLLIVGSFAAGAKVLRWRGRVLRPLTAAVDAGRADPNAIEQSAALAAEGVVGAVIAIVHTRLVSREAPLLELVNQLMSLIVLPYLGPEAAQEELQRALVGPAELPHTALPTVLANPLDGLNMRLTERTVRVLRAIAAHPGGPNRAIARAAGVEDQGQISRALSRLESLGLIANAAPGRGRSNAWYLTSRGLAIEQATAGP